MDRTRLARATGGTVVAAFLVAAAVAGANALTPRAANSPAAPAFVSDSTSEPSEAAPTGEVQTPEPSETPEATDTPEPSEAPGAVETTKPHPAESPEASDNNQVEQKDGDENNVDEHDANDQGQVGTSPSETPEPVDTPEPSDHANGGDNGNGGGNGGGGDSGSGD